MRVRLIERVLWVGFFFASALASWRWHREAALPVGQPRLDLTTVASAVMLDADSLAAAADAATSGNIFREDRGVSVEVDSSTEPVMAPRHASLPSLTLRGILGGPPWEVIIDGLPGRSGGTVVRDGETVAGWSIRVTSRDSVRLSSADTVWYLVLGR